MKFWQAVAAIVAKDVTTELRTKETLSAMLIFALMVLMVFSFAFELRVDNVRQIAPGVLWVAFSFAGVLGLNRSFIAERDNACIIRCFVRRPSSESPLVDRCVPGHRWLCICGNTLGRYGRQHTCTRDHASYPSLPNGGACNHRRNQIYGRTSGRRWVERAVHLVTITLGFRPHFLCTSIPRL